MSGELERAALTRIVEVLGGERESAPEWLKRPGRTECREHWTLVCEIYRALTDLKLPEVMPKREWREVDCILAITSVGRFIIEVDETQHFNLHRAKTLRMYPPETLVAYDVAAWTRYADAKGRLEGGGFGKARPPLFPGDGGRHRQRAFRDALCDILPSSYGFLPTLRIAYFEVEDWLYGVNATTRMRELLNRKAPALFQSKLPTWPH